MKKVSVPETKRARTDNSAVRAPLALRRPLLLAALFLLVSAPSASAFKVVSELGQGAGQTQGARGIALDQSSKRLYVADTHNHRVEIFDANGTFVKAFGWGVRTGASQFETCTSATKCKRGLEGAGRGQFIQPTGIAVDNDPSSPSFHSVYVLDSRNFRIQKFDPEGNFLLAWGAGVNETKVSEAAPKALQDVCPVDSADVCGAGSEGFDEGQLNTQQTDAFIDVGPGGAVHVVDSYRASETFKYRLQRYLPSGSAIPPHMVLAEGASEVAMAFGLAVHPSSGNVYVSSKDKIRKYDGSGTQIGEIETGGTLMELAFSPSGNLFGVTNVSGFEVSIVELDPAGNTVRRFGYGQYERVATDLVPYQSPSGDVYTSEAEGFSGGGGRVLHIDFPPPGPLVLPRPCEPTTLGNTKATLFADVNPEGKATTVHFEYMTEADFIANGGSFSGPNAPTSTDESPSIGSDFTAYRVKGAASLKPSNKYRCRVVAANADGTAIGPEGSFTSLPPLEIGRGWTSNVGVDAATLHSEVNPLGISTDGYFEYVDDVTYQADILALGPDHGFDHAEKAPRVDQGEAPLDFGAGEDFKAAASAIDGLRPRTTYRYRIVATNHPFEEVFRGPTEAFRTYSRGEGALPDSRRYELVSPGHKNSAEVAIPTVAGGFFGEETSPTRINVAATSGEAITYTSWTSFNDAEGAHATSQYVARRGAAGWSTENVTPFGFQKEPLELPYRGFTRDLRFAAFEMSEPPLTAEAQAGFANLYLRDNQTGRLQALTIEQPLLATGEGFCTGYAGASEDGQHAFFAARGALAAAPSGAGFSLYEWSGSGESHLNLVSVLPDGTPAPPVKALETAGHGTGFGAMGGNCQMGQGLVHNAVSKDGSVVFWRYGGEYEGAKQPLFARIGGGETIQLDAAPAANAGKGPFGGGQFWEATADGSKVFFTAPGKLTKDAKGDGQLYRYDTVGRSLVDLTPGTADLHILGVIGVSEDGFSAYFVAEGALTGEKEGPSGQKAQAGAHNLYLWRQGEGVRFIAPLAGLDEKAWDSVPFRKNARITPDGGHLAFLTVETETLSNYDNTIFPGSACQPDLQEQLNGDPRCPQAYLYDAEADELTCVSCNPAGSRPAGPTELPGWSNPYEGPRFLSDDGSRLYFESRDALSAADENGERDVYQFEREGAGSCTAQSPGFVAASSGCLSLISSGIDTDDTFLVDASASGRDVFFTSRSSFVGWDVNENYDVYDARIGGGFPEPPPTAQSCEAEDCKPPPTPQPTNGPPPATATFRGNGDERQRRRRCARGKHRSRKRCVGRRGKTHPAKQGKRRDRNGGGRRRAQ